MECVGCGYCCRKVPCGWGVQRMQEEGIQWTQAMSCPYLTQVGIQWRCGLYLSGSPSLREAMEKSLGIGAGCSSPLFNTDREAMLRKLSQSD